MGQYEKTGRDTDRGGNRRHESTSVVAMKAQVWSQCVCHDRSFSHVDCFPPMSWKGGRHGLPVTGVPELSTAPAMQPINRVSGESGLQLRAIWFPPHETHTGLFLVRHRGRNRNCSSGDRVTATPTGLKLCRGHIKPV